MIDKILQQASQANEYQTIYVVSDSFQKAVTRFNETAKALTNLGVEAKSQVRSHIIKLPSGAEIRFICSDSPHFISY
jgi:hypothetical protein